MVRCRYKNLVVFLVSSDTNQIQAEPKDPEYLALFALNPAINYIMKRRNQTAKSPKVGPVPGPAPGLVELCKNQEGGSGNQPVRQAVKHRSLQSTKVRYNYPRRNKGKTGKMNHGKPRSALTRNVTDSMTSFEKLASEFAARIYAQRAQAGRQLFK